MSNLFSMQLHNWFNYNVVPPVVEAIVFLVKKSLLAYLVGRILLVVATLISQNKRKYLLKYFIFRLHAWFLLNMITYSINWNVWREIFGFIYRAATAIFWQARPPQCQPHQRHASDAAAAFYSAKSRQGLGLGGLASRSGPDIEAWNNIF